MFAYGQDKLIHKRKYFEKVTLTSGNRSVVTICERNSIFHQFVLLGLSVLDTLNVIILLCTSVDLVEFKFKDMQGGNGI